MTILKSETNSTDLIKTQIKWTDYINEINSNNLKNMA